uniref:G_PROTEIN_RECEP_F1_2 domain-containing protein n=1 Tax=Haemonchus contortus TaxID=6289 RepID=A0A7I4YUH0_HAECO
MLSIPTSRYHRLFVWALLPDLMMNKTSVHVVQWQHQIIIFVNTYVLFFQILLGCSGNVLNLIVLISRKMRSRTNLIFALMAFADLFFLLMHIPQFLFFCNVLVHNSQRYRESVHFIKGVQNWLSAISIWCMMYATIERVQVLRSPFRTSRRTVSPRFLATIAIIVIGALGVTAQTFAPPGAIFSSRVSKTLVFIHVASVVVIPLVICSLLNILLVSALKKNTMPTQMLKDSQAQQTLLDARNKTERKVTIMVTVIITSFVVCNAPGAILAFLIQNNLIYRKGLTTALLQVLSNTLVTTAKVLNFLLFCMSSDHFRALLRLQLTSVFDCTSVKRRSSCRSATKISSVPLHDL